MESFWGIKGFPKCSLSEVFWIQTKPWHSKPCNCVQPRNTWVWTDKFSLDHLPGHKQFTPAQFFGAYNCSGHRVLRPLQPTCANHVGLKNNKQSIYPGNHAQWGVVYTGWGSALFVIYAVTAWFAFFHVYLLKRISLPWFRTTALESSKRNLETSGEERKRKKAEEAQKWTFYFLEWLKSWRKPCIRFEPIVFK